MLDLVSLPDPKAPPQRERSLDPFNPARDLCFSMPIDCGVDLSEEFRAGGAPRGCGIPRSVLDVDLLSFEPRVRRDLDRNTLECRICRGFWVRRGPARLLRPSLPHENYRKILHHMSGSKVAVNPSRPKLRQTFFLRNCEAGND